jgi:hypothetical protein
VAVNEIYSKQLGFRLGANERGNGSLTDVVNVHFVDYLAHLFNTFGIEHFDLIILSARLGDAYMSAEDNHIKLSRLWPIFMNALKAKMRQPFEKQVHVHSIMGWKEYIFYGEKRGRLIEVDRIGPSIIISFCQSLMWFNLEIYRNSPRHPERSEGSLANGMDCVQP